jgi:hypothetical protein
MVLEKCLSGDKLTTVAIVQSLAKVIQYLSLGTIAIISE